MTSWVPVTDPGLQPERTSMAWGRTSLAFMVSAAVLLRWAPHYGVAVGTVVGGLLAVALVILATQRRCYRRVAWGIAGESFGNSVPAVLGLSVCTVVLGCAGMLFVIVDGEPGRGTGGGEENRSRVENMSGNSERDSEEWYFDTATGEVTRGKVSGWNNRMGPYDSEAEARNALDIARARSEAADEWDED